MGGYPDEVIQKVWERARSVAFADPGKWRLDYHWAWICRRDYGNARSPFGWQIEREAPTGCDLLCNLRPGNIWWASDSEAAGALPPPCRMQGASASGEVT